MNSKKGYLYLLGAASSYASMGVLVKFLASELTPLWQTFLRLIVSSMLAYIYLALQKKTINLSSKKNWVIMIFMGTIAYGSSIIAYTYAFNYTLVGNVLFILSSYPIVTAILATPLLHEKLNKNHISGLVVLIAGLLLLFNPSNISQYLFGNALSFYVAITFSLYVIISRYLSKVGEHAETITFLSILIGCATSGILAIGFEQLPAHISISVFLGTIAFGCLNFIAHILVNKGFRLINASTGTMILMLEGVIGTILASIFFREIPSPLFLTGAVLILISVYISTRSAT